MSKATWWGYKYEEKKTNNRALFSRILQFTVFVEGRVEMYINKYDAEQNEGIAVCVCVCIPSSVPHT